MILNVIPKAIKQIGFRNKCPGSKQYKPVKNNDKPKPSPKSSIPGLQSPFLIFVMIQIDLQITPMIIRVSPTYSNVLSDLSKIPVTKESQTA